MISVYVRCGRLSEAVDCFYQFTLTSGLRPDFYTFPPVLKACRNLVDGKKIHCSVLKLGFEWDVFVAASLLHMYCRFGLANVARKLFDDMPVRDSGSWNAMISGYCQSGNAVEALDILDEMRLEGVSMDPITVASILPVCARSDNILSGLLIHLYIVKHGLEFNLFVSNNLINMYAKFGMMRHALRVFDQMMERDVVSWNSIIAAYEQSNDPITAHGFFTTMQQAGIQPDLLTLVSLTSIVAQLNDCRNSRSVHGFIMRRGWFMEDIHARVIKNCLCFDVFVATCLVDMYGKCGRIDDAMSLFYQVPRSSSVPWNAIISCHGIHGQGDKALNFFRQMLDEGVRPDHITFVSLLTACSHSGLVSEGQRYFHMMQEEFGIKPHLKHYGCMVDLFGRAGHLGMAHNFIQNMPVRPDASIWGALLGACRIHGNMELGAVASDRLFEVDSENVGYYVLMSNIYANVGKWEGVDEVRSLARDRGLKKTPGWSSIEVNNKVDIFYTGNRTHPKYEKIYDELRNLTAKMKSLGYVPDKSFVLQDVEEDEKEHILTSHSERLAIAFGIISSPPKSPIQIFKNLRVCGDCHNWTKFISQITEREIIVRDSNRFHRFKDGICSCGDYW
ncbi:pentatricopeptide repeat-containing protein [Citrus sinensis]|nr:pentatricopeptide repeat-containing protein [Citrus sinensis]